MIKLVMILVLAWETQSNLRASQYAISPSGTRTAFLESSRRTLADPVAEPVPVTEASTGVAVDTAVTVSAEVAPVIEVAAAEPIPVNSAVAADVATVDQVDVAASVPTDTAAVTGAVDTAVVPDAAPVDKVEAVATEPVAVSEATVAEPAPVEGVAALAPEADVSGADLSTAAEVGSPSSEDLVAPAPDTVAIPSAEVAITGSAEVEPYVSSPPVIADGSYTPTSEGVAVAASPEIVVKSTDPATDPKEVSATPYSADMLGVAAMPTYAGTVETKPESEASVAVPLDGVKLDLVPFVTVKGDVAPAETQRTVGTTEAKVSVLGDWAYCTCNSDGVNGTLVYDARRWPTVAPLSIGSATSDAGQSVSDSPAESPGSLIQLTFQGKRVAVARSDECECKNPWESFTDPHDITVCNVHSGVNICIVRTKIVSAEASPEVLKAQALELLKKIDAEFTDKSP